MGYLFAGSVIGAIAAVLGVLGGAPVWQGLAIHAGAGTATVLSMILIASIFETVRSDDEDGDDDA